MYGRVCVLFGFFVRQQSDVVWVVAGSCYIRAYSMRLKVHHTHVSSKKYDIKCLYAVFDHSMMGS